MSPTDHDRIVTVEHDTEVLQDGMKDVMPRLRRVEDSLLQAKTAAAVAKAVLGLVSVSIIIQIGSLLNVFK